MSATLHSAAPPMTPASFPVAVGSGLASFDFRLPPELEAGEPPEARGLRRDEVRLLVSFHHSRPQDEILHTQFRSLPEFLVPGDVLVVNTSGTLNAALPATGPDGTPFELHLSSHLPADLWVVEVRRLAADRSTEAYGQVEAGQMLDLPCGGHATLLTPYRPEQRYAAPAMEAGPAAPPQVRLWVAVLQTPFPLQDYLNCYGFPIRYKYVRQSWPLSYYQTVFATEMGSAEMPSAGRAFTAEIVTRLALCGVQIAPLLLHTGVASLEEHEPPYEEFYRVPAATARQVNAARRTGRRVIAVGTTCVRALESAAAEDGLCQASEGWTDLVITPERGMRLVDGLLTGLHEPRSSHLAMLSALAGEEHLKRTYAEALAHGYLWHEFGDLHLILP